MYRSRYLLIYSLLSFIAVGAVVGLLLGYFFVCLVIALLAWSAYQISHFVRVMEWLSKEDLSEPPQATGAWGDLLDGLYRLQRRHRDKEKNLRSIILRFQQSSAALEDAVVIIDKKGHLEWWNRSAETLLGLSFKADRHKSLINILRDPRFVRFFKKEHYTEPLELASPLHPQVTLQYSITRFGDGDRLLVARDISQLKRLEQTRQLFVANASHELRTPLTVLRGYLETFIDQDFPAGIKRALLQMSGQTQRMETLVKDLLLLSRLESSQHVSDEYPVNLPYLLKRIVRDANLLSGEKSHRIHLQLNSNMDILGQETELQSAFSNLIFNAVRYTPPESRLHITWSVDTNGGHLSVKDNGPGIESFHLPRLTERFYRVDEGRSSETGGTGLGLSIVKHVLARHGAKLEIKSKLGVGSEFICHFPVDMLTDVEIEEPEVDNNISHH